MIQRPIDFPSQSVIDHGQPRDSRRSINGLAPTFGVPKSVFRQPVEYALDVAADDADAGEQLWPVMFGERVKTPPSPPANPWRRVRPLRNRHNTSKSAERKAARGD